MISTNIKGARASVDSGEAGAVPLVVEVKPGTYKVKVEAKGYFPVTQDYAVVEGQFRVIEVALKEKPALVTIRTDSGATVAVDGRTVGTTPFDGPIELTAGKHLITVSARGRYGWSREIEVGRGDKQELSASLSRTRQRTIAWVVLGASALTFAGGGLTALGAAGANGDAGDLEDKRMAETLTPAELDERNAHISERDDLLNGTYVLLGVGGALAVTGGLLYIMDTPTAEALRPDDGRSVVVAPMVTGSVTGVALGGRF